MKQFIAKPVLEFPFGKSLSYHDKIKMWGEGYADGEEGTEDF